MVDTGMIGKGIGIAALGIGTGMAFESLQQLQKKKPKKKQCFEPTFKPPKFKF